MADSWNSVQIVTLVVGALTPITVVVLGVLFTRASRRIEQVQWGNQTVITATDADALLRAEINHHLGDRRKLPWWDDNMTRLFTTGDTVETGKVQTAYDRLMEQFRADLNITGQARPLLATPS